MDVDPAGEQKTAPIVRSVERQQANHTLSGFPPLSEARDYSPWVFWNCILGSALLLLTDLLGEDSLCTLVQLRHRSACLVEVEAAF